MTAQADSYKIPSYFIKRRLHSLLGLWLVIFLMEHLFVNSQAALWLGEKGEGFIRMVNFLERLPYLRVLEIVLLGFPIGFHMVLGIQYALKSTSSAYIPKKDSPYLPFGRNRAYFWQRMSSWILLFGIIFHVGQMRFFLKPKEVDWGPKKLFLTPVTFDEGLLPLSVRLQISLFSEKDLSVLQQEKEDLSFLELQFSSEYDPFIQKKRNEEVEKQKNAFLKEALKNPLKKGEVLAVSPDPGTAFLLILRNTFKSIPMTLFYTLFLAAAVFHAFNGLWTFLLSWGLILSIRSQKKAVNVCFVFLCIFAFLGLASIWGSYWLGGSF